MSYYIKGKYHITLRDYFWNSACSFLFHQICAPIKLNISPQNESIRKLVMLILKKKNWSVVHITR